MEPTLRPGDWAGVDRRDTHRDGSVFAFRDEFGEICIFRLRRARDAYTPSIEIMADNPKQLAASPLLRRSRLSAAWSRGTR